MINILKGNIVNKPIVLVIHGMGTHEENGVIKEVTDGLNEAAKNLGLADFDISDRLEFVEYNYSSFLDEIRQRDAEHASSISEHLTFLQGLGLGEEIVNEMTGLLADFNEDEMLYTHWLDVIYYGLMFWGERIRVDFAKKINDVMITANEGAKDVHIIAHSLGTAITHDTLVKLYRGDVDITTMVPGLDINKFKIKSLWTVANVSRLLFLLNDIKDPNESIVDASYTGCCDHFVNVRNYFDPFTWFKQYNNDVGDYQLIEIDTIRILNTHDLTEYMASPDVADYLFGYMLGIPITEEMMSSARLEHGKTSLNKPLDELKLAFSDLRSQSSPVGRVEALKQLFTSAKVFKDRLHDIIEGDDNE